MVANLIHGNVTPAILEWAHMKRKKHAGKFKYLIQMFNRVFSKKHLFTKFNNNDIN